MGKKNQSDRKSHTKVENFWINRELGDTFVCPNVSLFRLLGSVIGKLDGKKVLEVGFGLGADIKECKRRGAQVQGLDLNPEYVKNLKANHDIEAYVFKAGVDNIVSNVFFDLIYSRDTIYYLTNEQIDQFFWQCYRSLEKDGSMIIQFIEKDFKRDPDKKNKLKNFEKNFLSNYEPAKIYDEDNPIRLLLTDELVSLAEKNNFSLLGSKLHLQSYDLNENEIRVDKYLIFKK